MLKISVTGNAKLSVKNLARRTGNLSKPTKQAIAYKERRTKLQFASETSPEGDKWAPLKPSTLRQKKTSAILTETSSLKGSIAGRARGNTGQVSAGTDYGIYHQTGTSRMAQRKILGWAPDDVDLIQQIYEKHIFS